MSNAAPKANTKPNAPKAPVAEAPPKLRRSPREIREALYRDPLAVPNWEAIMPGWHPRWIDTDSERLSRRLTGHGGDGYAIVRKQTYDETVELAKRLGLNEGYVSRTPFPCIRYGKLMLAKAPLVEIEARKTAHLEDLRDRQRAFQEEFLEKNTREGVKAFIKEYEEMLDRKLFALRETNDRVSLAGIDPRAAAQEE